MKVFLGLVIIIIGIALFFLINKSSIIRDNFAVQPTIAPSLTPRGTIPVTPSPNTYEGTIAAITSETVGYKNSLIATVETEDGEFQVYITNETVITEAGDDTPKDRSVLEERAQILFVGIPSEGGLEAEVVTIFRES